MNKHILSLAMMAVGSITALVLAAAPLDSSTALRFLLGLALLLLAGGALLRRKAAWQVQRSDAHGERSQHIQASLHALYVALQEIQGDSEISEDTAELHRALQERTRQPIRDFLQNHRTLQDTCGFGAFARLMMCFASVERTINRALSASADGVLEETRHCLARSVPLMEACLATYAEIQKTSVLRS
jgi:hypothetical protein